MKKVVYHFLYAIALCATIYYNGLYNPIAKTISMSIFAVLFVMALFDRWKKNDRPKLFNRWLLWMALALIINILFAYDKLKVEDLLNFTIAMPLMIAFSSYHLFDVKREALPLYMLPICLFAAYCAIITILSGLGSFQVLEFYDEKIAKNQIGAAYTAFAIICAVFAIENKQVVLKVLYIALSIACIYPALYLTCRTALIAYMIVVVYLLFRYYRWRGLLVVPLVIIMVVLVGGEGLHNLLYDSIVGNRDVADANSLSSNRVAQADDAFHFFLNHPFFGYFGSVDSEYNMPAAAHIYILYKLTLYGIFGAIPFLALYISIFKIFIEGIKTNNLLLTGVLLLAFVESFSEYSPPFGPGSCYTVNFVLIGYFLKQQKKSLHSK